MAAPSGGSKRGNLGLQRHSGWHWPPEGELRPHKEQHESVSETPEVLLLCGQPAMLRS